MFICVNYVKNNIGDNMKRRTKEDDIRDVLLELCRYSGSSAHTGTGLAEKLQINKGQISTAVKELGAHVKLEIGFRGAHQITLRHDIPTLELLHEKFGDDFQAQDVVMKSDCFRDAAMETFDQFCKTIANTRYNIYRVWMSSQPPTPEEQKIFNEIRRDRNRAHVYEPSYKIEFPLVDSSEQQYRRIAPPDAVDATIEIAEADREHIQAALDGNWLGVKFMLYIIDPENDPIRRVERFMSFVVEKRKARCIERHDCAIQGCKILTPGPFGMDSIDPARTEKLEEYIHSIPVVDVFSFLSELNSFYSAFWYLL